MSPRGTIAALVIAAAAAPAIAQNQEQGESQEFTFTYSDAITLATGTLNATPNGNGSFTAFSGTLTITGSSFDGFYTLWQNPVAPSTSYSPSGRFIIDNQVFPSSPSLLNVYGLLFVNGSREVNIWGNGDGNPWSMWSSEGGGGGYDYSVNDASFTLSAASAPSPAVPSPGSLALCTLGFFITRRRR